MASITFAGESISGLFETPKVDTPRIQVARTKFFGVLGESEIHGGGGGRQIVVPCYLFDNYSSAQAVIDRIAAMTYWAELGSFGPLEFTGLPVPRVYKDVTFEGFEEDQQVGILEDVAGTLDGGWFVKGTLYFYDLRGED